MKQEIHDGLTKIFERGGLFMTQLLRISQCEKVLMVEGRQQRVISPCLTLWEFEASRVFFHDVELYEEVIGNDPQNPCPKLKPDFERVSSYLGNYIRKLQSQLGIMWPDDQIMLVVKDLNQVVPIYS